MEFFSLLLLLFIGLHLLRGRERAARVALLGSYLSRYQIEKLMEALTDGYLRALGEADAERRQQIWGLLATTEKNLVLQFQSFADDFAQVAAQDARVSRLPLALPYASRWWPAATFDMRAMLRLHARGIAEVAADVGDGSPEARKAQAFTMTAELYLMQHSCHWFCRSATMASVRLVALHQTGYEQVLASVSRRTRDGYRQLTGI
ncbi:MAG: hypothetical protein LWW82_13930 [Comamonadaceae bacterium]|jgi:hypothetical protein|nr:hypothetical protein [Comamonadaceae bacterium]